MRRAVKLRSVSTLLMLGGALACEPASPTAPARWAGITVSASVRADADLPATASRYWVRFTNAGEADAWFHHEQRIERLVDGRWIPALDGDTWIVEGAPTVSISAGSTVQYATFFTTDDVPAGTLRLVVRVHQSDDRDSDGRWIASEPLALR